jgi:hypothetical protein
MDPRSSQTLKDVQSALNVNLPSRVFAWVEEHVDLLADMYNEFLMNIAHTGQTVRRDVTFPVFCCIMSLMASFPGSTRREYKQVANVVRQVIVSAKSDVDSDSPAVDKSV